MRPNQSSLTAMGAAAQRAIEMERPAKERICCAPIARQFLSAWFYVLMKSLTASGYAQKRAAGDLGFIVARCRYYVTFVPVDFTRQTLAARLPEYGYSGQLKTLFIWEGVTMYLDASSVDSTLAFIAGHSAPGSAIVFDYMCKQLVLPKRDIGILLVSFFRSLFNERRGFKIEADQIEPFLTGRGFNQVRNVTAADLRARYFTGRNAGRKVTSDYAIAIGAV